MDYSLTKMIGWSRAFLTVAVFTAAVTTANPNVTESSATENDDNVAPTSTTYPPTVMDCNFDGGHFCHWTNVAPDDYDWTLQHTSVGSFNAGPAFDHTTQSSNGYYIYMKTSSTKENATARLLSPEMTLAREGLCLKFSYHMFGGQVGRLNIYARQGQNQGKPLFTKVGNQGYEWIYNGFHLTPETLSHPQTGPTRIQLEFEGVTGKGSQGVIAVDDISFNQGPCPSVETCDFESSDICQYQQDLTDTSDWLRAHGSVNLPNRGPISDHTYKTVSGHYMLLERPLTQSHGSTARLIGQHFQQATSKCLQFYYMSGSGTGLLNIYFKKNGNMGHPVWTISENRDNEWIPGEINLNSDQPFDVVFEGKTKTSYIAIDDISVKNRLCQPTGGCDFEMDTCSWTNDKHKDDFDWLRDSHGRDSYGTGPYTDHTLGSGNGHYMYIEAAAPWKLGEKARLKSEVLMMPTGGCLNFWYQMYGSGMGTLYVYLDDSNGNSNMPLKRLWFRSGNQGPGWYNAEVSLRSATHFRIVFEGIIGLSHLSDIAVDDIMITTGLCSSSVSSISCKSGRVVSVANVCNFNADCPDGSDEASCGNCTFESGLCSWNDTSHGSYRWQRAQNHGSSGILGFSTDHTKGTKYGYFLYTDAGQGSPATMATISSPTIRDSSSTCQMHFYYMNADANQYITISLQVGSRVTEIYRTDVQTNTTWMGAYADIGRIRSPFKVQIQTIKNRNTSGGVAVDDISFVNCGNPRFGRHCDRSPQFRCRSLACIDKSRVCDSTDDCGDNSDENEYMCHNASTCTFERSFCDWIQSSYDNFDWTRHRGPTLSDLTGPTRDHTTNINSGYYIYTETSSPRRSGDKAQLLSRVISPVAATTGCTFTFYYNMYGRGTGTLNVYLLAEHQDYPYKIWSKTGDLGNFWERATIPLANSQPFQIMLEGIRGTDYTGDIAVDDTVFSTSCKFTDDASFGTAAQYPSTSPGTTVNPCSNGGHQCGNGTCVGAKRVCDYTIDCTDHSDERNCGPCDFESDSCGWIDYSTGRYNWDRNSDLNTSRKTPFADHTLGNNKGHYMYIEGPSSGIYYSSAVLVSPPLPKPSKFCKIIFYENTNGDNTGLLQVGTVVNGTFSLMAAYRADPYNNASTWYKHIVYIGGAGDLQNGYKIQFRGHPSRGYLDSQTDVVAIDDISFQDCNAEMDVSTSISSITRVTQQHVHPTGWTSGTTENPTPDITTTASHVLMTSPADFRQAIHLKCLHHGWYVAVDISKLPHRPTNVTNIYMGIDSCTGSIQGDLLVFNQTYGQCDTHARVVNGKMTFSNYLLYVVPNSFHIIRHIHWEYNVQCSHPLSANGTLHITPKLNVTKQGSSSGEITGSPIEVSMFKDSTFNVPFRGTASVGSSVYVQVTSLSHPDVVMVLDSCKASVEGKHPSQQKSFPLIEQHCSMEPTTQILTVRNQLTRFKFDMFDLPNDHDGIYVTCSVHFCDQMDLSPRCDQKCQLRPNPVIG